MAERREVRIAFIGDASDLKRATQTAERSLTSFEATSSRVTKGFGVAAASIATGVAAFTATGIAAGIAGKSFVDAASSYEEAASKVNVVFGGAAGKVTAFTKTATKQFGISERSAMDWAGGLGALLRPMGLTEDAAADMSTQLTGLAGDFASFYNTSPEDALIAIKAGLVGEAEPLRRYGILLNEARIKQEAMTKGLYSGKGELSAYARAQSVMSLIMKDSTLAQGDYVRTQDSTANKLRLLGQEWDNFKVQIGEALLPLAGWIADTGVKVLNWLSDLKTMFDQGGWGAVWDKFRADLQKGWDETIWPWLQALPGKVGEWVKTTGGPALGTALAGLGEAFANWASTLWSGQDITMKGTATLISSGSVLQTPFEEKKHIDGLKDKLAQLPEAIKGFVTEKYDDVKNSFRPWADAALSWTDQAAEESPDRLNKMTDAMDKWAGGEGAQRTAAMGGALAAQLLQGFYGGLLAVDYFLLQWANKIVTWIGDPSNWAAVLNAVWRIGWDIVKTLATAFANFLDTLLSPMPDWLKSALGVNALTNDIRNFVESTTPEGRAIGGPVASGMPYIVGERGPELFVPRQSGTIVPNANTYNISGLNHIQALQLIHAHERMAMAGAA